MLDKIFWDEEEVEYRLGSMIALILHEESTEAWIAQIHGHANSVGRAEPYWRIGSDERMMINERPWMTLYGLEPKITEVG